MVKDDERNSKIWNYFIYLVSFISVQCSYVLIYNLKSKSVMQRVSCSLFLPFAPVIFVPISTICGFWSFRAVTMVLPRGISSHIISRAMTSSRQKYHIFSHSPWNGAQIKVERYTLVKQSCGFHRCQHQLAEKRGTGSEESINKELPTKSVTHDILPSTQLPNLPPMPPKPKKKVTNFIFAKFFGFVQGYNKVLEKNFPGAMNVYRVFVVGFKDFSKELAEYVKVSKKALLASKGVRDLTSAELDVYYRMPKEMFRVGPTLLISALPFMNYIMFPVAYYFPKKLLSSHFWSIQQKSRFAIETQKQRLYNYRPVLRCLQANVALVRDKNMQKQCEDILDKLGSGSHPSGREIMEIKPLFESDPFSINAIYGPHVKGLCRTHGIHTLYLKRKRLNDRAEMLHILDTAMIKEGIFNLKTEELKTACFLRGLNASNTCHEDMMEYLQQWCSISTTISPHSYSLLLHLPILLSYNNPNNWALLV